MAIPWNIVTKNISPEDARVPLQKKVRQKIAQFEKFLEAFPMDAVHLQIVFERHPRKDLYTATLTLRVPSDILHTQKSGRDVIGAFDEAVKALLRELESYKSNLRGEESWKRKERRKKLHQLKAMGFAIEPQREGEGPQDHREVVHELFRQHDKELLRHARRHLLNDELAGDLPNDAVSPRDVLKEVERRAVAGADEGPKNGSWLNWFYHLVHEELKRQRRLLKQRDGRDLSGNKTKDLRKGAKRSAGAASKRSGPDGALEEEIVRRGDAVAQLEQDMRNWARSEREVFELYYVEGLEPEEIAMVTQQPLDTVRENLASIQSRLREEMLARAAVA
jgi:ribosomal subunit interface protein